MYRYKLVDTNHPKAVAGRYRSLTHGLREISNAGPPGRFILVDRETGRTVARS